MATIPVAGLNRWRLGNSLAARRRGNPISRRSTLGLRLFNDCVSADFWVITHVAYFPRSAWLQRIASFALLLAISITGFRPGEVFGERSSLIQNAKKRSGVLPFGLLRGPTNVAGALSSQTTSRLQDRISILREIRGVTTTTERLSCQHPWIEVCP